MQGKERGNMSSEGIKDNGAVVNKDLTAQARHGHAHTHDAKEMKAVINRLAKAIGHLEAVKGMVENGRDCSEVLVQLAAVKSALNNTGKLILKEHIRHCIVEAIEEGDERAIEDLNCAIDQFVK